MKKEEKRMILILIIVAILVIEIVYLITRNKEENNNIQIENITTEEFVQKLESETKLNNSTKLSETKMFEGLEIRNIQLTNTGEKTELIAEVKNSTNEDKEAILVNIILYNKNGDEIATLGGRISPIKAGATIQFSTTATIDYSNAYDFKIEKK